MATTTDRPAGAAAVSRLADLPRMEAWWVGTLRAYCDGTRGPLTAIARLEAAMPRDRAVSAHVRLADLMMLFAEFARRPLSRHAEGCPCVGADEAVFALLCATAGRGEREDATMIASLILRPDVAPIAVSLAESIGLDLTRGRAAATMH